MSKLLARVIIMKLPTRKESIEYLCNQALAHFIGFCIGIYSTGIVSTFFETRSISNLWGLLARKTVVDEGTFNVLERVIAVLIGFIVFEIISKNLKPLLDRLKPVVENGIVEFARERGWDAKWKELKLVQFAKERGWDAKWKKLKADLNTKRIAFFASVNVAARNASKKHSTR